VDGHYASFGGGRWQSEVVKVRSPTGDWAESPPAHKKPRNGQRMRRAVVSLHSLTFSALTLALCDSSFSRSALLFQAPLSFLSSAIAPRNLHSKKSMGHCAALRTEIIPSQEQHDSVIIFLHGSGDSGQGIAEALKSLGFSFRKTKIVCPTAPFRKYSLYGDEGK
jgi:hypothetical protein